MKLSHTVQFAGMEFANRCASIRSFCTNVYPMLEASHEVYEHIRAEAKKRDYEHCEENSEQGEEREVAYEQYPVSEAIQLVGLFSLVYIVCAIEKFIDGVMKSCGWKIDQKRGKSEIEVGWKKSRKRLESCHCIRKIGNCCTRSFVQGMTSFIVKAKRTERKNSSGMVR